MSCIVVMGCYRSGTSAVAGILHHLGVDMGSNFQEPNANNPKGYFEDPKFLEANLKIYEAIQIVDDFDHHSRMFEAKKAFHALVEAREKRDITWGFKDPKFCLTAKHVELPPETKIIWIHRDIDETAMSIIKSLSLHGKDANMDKWRVFVKHYRDEAVNYMAGVSIHDGLNTLDLNLPDLLASPRTHINEIANFIGMDDWAIPEHSAFTKIRRAYKFMEE